MKIYKLIGILADGEIRFIKGEWEFIKETKSYYEIKSEMRTKRLKKEELNKIFSDINNNTKYISFACFCEEYSIVGKEEEIRLKLKETANQYYANIQELMKVFI